MLTRKGPLIDFLPREVTAANASSGCSPWPRSHLRLVGDRTCDHSLVQCDGARKGPTPRRSFSYRGAAGEIFEEVKDPQAKKGALLPPRRIKET